MLKKIIFFIFTLLLIFLLVFTGCLFVGPCKTKIKEYIPEKYSSYLDFSNENNIKEEEKKEQEDLTKIDISDNAQEIQEEEEVNDFGVKEENKETTDEEKKQENKEIVDKQESIIDNPSDDGKAKKEDEELVKKQNKMEEEQKSKELEKQEKIEKKSENISEDEEKKDEGKKDEGKKLLKEEIRRKLKEKLEAKRKKEENNMLEKQKETNKIQEEEKASNQTAKKRKKMTFIATVNGVKKTIEVEKYLGNGIYYTTTGDLFLGNNRIKKVENINNFKIKKLSDNIALLEEKKGDNKEIYLVDIKEKKSYKIYEKSKLVISNAKKVNDKIIFMLKSNYVDGGIFVFDTKTEKSKKVFSNSENNIGKDSFSYRKIIDFNIFSGNIGNSLIEITYEGQNGKEMKKIIGGLK